MKKIVAVIGVMIVVLLGAIFGYKTLYKVSPRDFITQDTRVIYANEGINSKDFTPVLNLIDDGKLKEEITSNLKNLKYISKFYMLADKEFYQLDERSFVGVVDTGYWYFLALKEIEKYFELDNGIYVMKKDMREKYFPNVDRDIFMKNYRGLFLFSMGEKNLKDFIAKDKKYIYNKEIENTLDINRENLFGTLIYNNSGTDFYGINFLTSSATLKDGKVVSTGEIILDEKEIENLKTTKENRELLKYIDNNTIYIAVDDFSKLDKFIFNPFLMGGNIDGKAVMALWKNLLGIDIDEMLKEIDGEVLIDIERNSFMIKLKEEAPEIRRVMNMLKDKNSAFYSEIAIEERDGTLIIGDGKFKENTKFNSVGKNVFIYGKIDSSKITEFEGIESSIIGEENRVNMRTEIPMEIFKKLLIGY